MAFFPVSTRRGDAVRQGPRQPGTARDTTEHSGSDDHWVGLGEVVCTACGRPKESWGFLPQLYRILWGCPCRGPSRGLACAELDRGCSSLLCEKGEGSGSRRHHITHGWC